MKPQILLCASDAQVASARLWFPSLEARYINCGDYSQLEGERVVCLSPAIAPLAFGYAAEVKTVSDEIPTLPDNEVAAWVKKHAHLYAQNPAPQEVDPLHRSTSATASQEVKAGEGLAPPHSSPPPAELDTVSAPSEPPEWEDIPDHAYEPETPPVGFPASPSGYSGPIQPPDQPADLWGSDESLPVMPPECYPEALRAYIEDESAVMGCDPGMLALYCIAICAGCVTDEIRVQVKSASDRWQESARIWAMIVGDSGLTMKSPTLDSAISHAWKIERELRLAGGQALKDHAIECQIYETQKAEYVKHRAKGEPAEMPAEPAPPISERLIVGNATLEAISDVLLQQGERGVLVRADELLGIIAGMNQYKGGKGSDRQDWLEMWNGGPHPIDRKGRAVLIQNWSVSIVGGTQPEAIARIGQQLESDGLLQRFTVYLPRHAKRGRDTEGDPLIRRRYHDVLDRLAKLVPQPDRAPVRFTPEAYQVIAKARDWIFDMGRGPSMASGLRSHLAKWPAILARLCLAYAAIEAADEHYAAIQPTISADIANQVWSMMRGPLWDHAQHFYENTLYGARADRTGARQIAGLILASHLTEIDARTMTQRSTIFRNATPFLRRDILIALCDLGWLAPTGGKSVLTGMPTHYTVNAAVHHLFPHIAQIERESRAERTKTWNEAKAANREPGEE